MTKTLTALAVSVGLAFGGASALAASPATTQVVTVSPAKGALARHKVEVVTRAIQRTTAFTGAINDPSLGNATTAEDYIAAIDAMTPQIEAARAELSALRAEVEALPDVAGEGDPVQLQQVDVMAVDFLASAERMDDLLGSIVDLGAALKRGDSAGTEKALATLSQGMMVALDGQAAMFRARVALSDPDSFVYAQTMSLACLYESLAAVTRGQLEFLPAAEAAAKSEAALVCARGHMAAGRQALVQSGKGGQTASARALQARVDEISGRMLEESATAESALASATAVLKSGGDFDAIEVELDKFQAAELAISRLANEQMVAATGARG